MTNAIDPDTCNTSGRQCNAVGNCGDPTSTACTTADTCASNVCADGRCCASACGVCHSCGYPTAGTCTPIRGYDDTGECDSGRSCSDSSTCLYVDQQMSTFPSDNAVTSIEYPFAQVIAFATAGSLEEVRMYVYCANQMQPMVWLEGVDSSGQPNGMRLRDATDVEQDWPPNSPHHFYSVELATPLDMKPGDRVAVVVRGMTGIECYVSWNDQVSYPGGAAFFSGPNDNGMWVQKPGALVFQALVNR